jgi:5-formyltetrahydrofolate cyclo-ligase
MNKDSIRKEILLKRLELSAEERRLRSRALQTRLFNREEFRKAKRIQFYISFNHEVETREMIGRALEIGKKVFVPYLKEAEGEIGLSELRDLKQEVQKNRNGFEEPFGPFIRPSDPAGVDLWVIPGVVFDLSGNRIGYGKGFYDRLLSSSAQGIFTGIAFDLQLVDTIPVEAHDVRMNQIVTEYRTIEVGKNKKDVER